MTRSPHSSARPPRLTAFSSIPSHANPFARFENNIRNLLDDDDPLHLTGLWDRTTQSFLYTKNQMKEPRSFVVTSTFGW